MKTEILVTHRYVTVGVIKIPIIDMFSAEKKTKKTITT